MPDDGIRKSARLFPSRAEQMKTTGMKQIIFSLISFCACLPLAGAIVDPGDCDVQFVNNHTEEFTGLVGQIITRTGLVHFADAEIPPDPDHPVDRAGGSTSWDDDPSVSLNVYSLEIEGVGASQFSASIQWRSMVSNECTVAVFYTPTAMGTHRATLKVTCSNADVPVVTIPLWGEATGILGDLDGNGLLTVSDVTGLVGSLLRGDACMPIRDINSDGMFSISDVTLLIQRLLADR